MAAHRKKIKNGSDNGLRKEFTSDIMFNDIVGKVKSNEFKEGDTIAGENNLIKNYGISLSSVRLATKKLVDNGYLVTMPKIGKYIRNPDLHRFKRVLVLLQKEMFGHYSSIEYFTMQYLLGIMNFASRHNWYVQLVVSSVKKTDTGNAFTEDINLLGIDGVALHNFAGNFEMKVFDPYGHKIPTVNSGTIQPVRGAHSANIDFELAAYTATEWLLRQGHREIGYMGEDNNPHFMRLRAGFERAMSAAGVVVPPERIMEVKGYQEMGYYFGEIKRIFEAIPRAKLPTAIVFGSDRYLRLSLDAMHGFGIRMPDDISVISVENSFEIQEIQPAITRVDTSFYTLGQLASELLHRVMFEPEGAGPFTEIVPLTVLEKSSVKRLLP